MENETTKRCVEHDQSESDARIGLPCPVPRCPKSKLASVWIVSRIQDGRIVEEAYRRESMRLNSWNGDGTVGEQWVWRGPYPVKGQP